MFLHNTGPFYFSIFMDEPLLEARFLGKLLEQSACLASKLRKGPLLEHGPNNRDYMVCQEIKDYIL